MNKRLILLLASAAILLMGCGPEEDPIIIPGVYPDDEEQTTGGDDNYQAHAPYKVDCKKSVSTGSWTTYDAYTVDCIQGFRPEADPETDQTATSAL